jgi:superfamily II DNA or RNA helicase
MDAGYLVRPRIFTSDVAPDLKGITVRAGDYAPGELAAACDRPTLVGDIVAHYQRHGGGQRAVVFAAGVEHSRHLTEAFRAAGIAAEHLDGKTPAEERDAILTRLREGSTRVVSNVGVLTEGWDEPLVGVVILARPTKSVALMLQMAGRGLRPAEGKSAVLLDHAGCVAAHGAPQDPREWSLAGKAKRAGATGGASPLKRCPECGRMVERTEPVCPECGYEWPAAECRPLEQVEGDLREITEAELEARAVERQRKAVNRLLGRHVGALCGAGVESAEAWTRVNRAVYGLRRKSRTKMCAMKMPWDCPVPRRSMISRFASKRPASIFSAF